MNRLITYTEYQVKNTKDCDELISILEKILSILEKDIAKLLIESFQFVELLFPLLFPHKSDVEDRSNITIADKVRNSIFGIEHNVNVAKTGTIVAKKRIIEIKEKVKRMHLGFASNLRLMKEGCPAKDYDKIALILDGVLDVLENELQGELLEGREAACAVVINNLDTPYYIKVKIISGGIKNKLMEIENNVFIAKREIEVVKEKVLEIND